EGNFANQSTSEEPSLEFSKRLRKEIMNGVAKGAKTRVSSEPDPPQTGGDYSSSPIITPEMEFDTEQFRTSDRKHSEELPFINGKEKRSSTTRPGKYKQSTRDDANIHNKLYRAIPAQRYHAAMNRLTGSGSLKLQTNFSHSSSINICKNSYTNKADTIPSTSVLENAITTSSSQHL
ncbi:hypothetical protein ACTXT7_009305, partial [Hymenolepis weldensis]